MSRTSGTAFHQLLQALQSNGLSGIKNQSTRVRSPNFSSELPFWGKICWLEKQSYSTGWRKGSSHYRLRKHLVSSIKGIADPSRYSKEEISDDEAFCRVQRLLRNVKKIPVVPDTFSAASPPKQVLDKSSRYVVIEYFTIGFAFCRRMWIALRVVIHHQAFILPFVYPDFSIY